MMATVGIPIALPEDIYVALKERAAANGRPAYREAEAIIQRALTEETIAGELVRKIRERVAK